MKTIEDENLEIVLNMSRLAFLETVEGWKDSMIEQGLWDGIQEDLQKNPLHCPVHQWVVANHSTCSRELVPNTAKCPICGNFACPDCMNHGVEVISRVTGYLGTVSGWNEAKQQELKDRVKHDLGRGGMNQ